MKIKFSLSFFILIFLLPVKPAYSQYKISGRIANYDSLWSDQLFLSLVEPDVPFNHISSDQIINSTSIDKEGYFTLEGNLLPETNSIVRLYLTREGTNVLFSGYPRNYLLLIINNQSQINIETEDCCLSSLDYVVTGDLSDQNQDIIKLEHALRNLRTATNVPPNESEKIRALYQSKYIKMLKEFCGKTKFPLVKLLTLQNFNIEDDFSKDQDFYSNLLVDLKENPQNSTPYITAFEKKITLLKRIEENEKSNYINIMFYTSIILFVATGCILFYRSFTNKNHVVNNDSDGESSESLIAKLTPGEKRILASLVEGYQNKEIAEMLHIEVSTVKTHLTNIYKKLNIKGRKEALNFKDIADLKKD